MQLVLHNAVGELGKGMSNPADEHFEHYWRLFPILPHLLLPALPRSRDSSTLRTLRDRFNRFEAGDWASLWDYEAVEPKKPARSGRSRAPGPSNDQVEEALDKCMEALRVNERKRAVQAAFSEGPAGGGRLRDQLQELHPRAGDTEESRALEIEQWAPLFDPDPRKPSPDPYYLQPLFLWKALRESPRGSATGPSGWSYELLSPLLQNRDEETHRAWEKVANLLANGAVPDACRLWFGAAYLGGISKTDGGVRPIAAGEVLRRWMGKAMLSQDRDELASFFLNRHQVGVGVQAGAELAYRVVDLALAAFDDENAAALFDCANAFNSVLRSKIFAEVRRHFPRYLPHLRLSYLEPKDLFLKARKGETVRAERGVEQGDPWGPFLFALVFASATDKIAPPVVSSYPRTGPARLFT